MQHDERNLGGREKLSLKTRVRPPNGLKALARLRGREEGQAPRRRGSGSVSADGVAVCLGDGRKTTENPSESVNRRERQVRKIQRKSQRAP